jgi:murein peptide amidase A
MREKKYSRHIWGSLKMTSSLLLIVFLFASLGPSDELVLTQKTQNGNLIRCYKKGDSGKKILLIGSVHGFEKAGILLSVKILNEIFATDKLSNTLICIPSANPDGNVLDTRMNANRIDINRNFPATNWVYVDSAKLKNEKIFFWGGAEPASEIETRFIMKVDSIYNPEIIIVFHQFLDLVNYDGIGLPLAEYIIKETGMKLEQDLGYDTPGSMGSYFGTDKRKEMVTIELPENPPDSLQQSLTKAIVDLVVKDY